MNTLNLNPMVDSTSIFHQAETIGQMEFHSGLTCELNPFDSSFVALKSAGASYKLGNQVVSYPLYSKGEGRN